jgi:tryptophan synthase beta chain
VFRRTSICRRLAAKTANQESVILFTLSGHGLLDLSGYFDYLHGHLPDE